MRYDATLKKLFRQPPNRLLSFALGKPVTVVRTLPTDLITVENLHPDLLFEERSGELIHAEMQGYQMSEFACRNLIYYGLLLRDYKRHPQQIVFWIGRERVGVSEAQRARMRATKGRETHRSLFGGRSIPRPFCACCSEGLSNAPYLEYSYKVIDVRDIDAGILLEGVGVGESIFAILCNLKNERQTIVEILRRISELPKTEQREAIAELLVLSGLRGLKAVVREEISHMPLTFDIHENEFLEEVFQEGMEKGSLDTARKFVADLLEERFGPLPPAVQDRLQSASLADMRAWGRAVLKSNSLNQVFDAQ